MDAVDHLRESPSVALPSNSEGDRLPLLFDLNIFSNFCISPPRLPPISSSLDRTKRFEWNLTQNFTLSRSFAEIFLVGVESYNLSVKCIVLECQYIILMYKYIYIYIWIHKNILLWSWPKEGMSTIPWMWSFVSWSFLFASLRIRKYMITVQHVDSMYIDCCF